MRKVLIYGGVGAVAGAIAIKRDQSVFAIHLADANEEALMALAGELEATFTVGDINEEGFFKKVIDEAGGELEGLVYAVGTINLKSIRRLTEEDFLTDFRLNAMGAAQAVQAALPALKKGGPGTSVVLFSSIAARKGFPMHASIAMAKGAVEGLVVSLAAELAPNIRVNGVAPSLLEGSRLSASVLGGDESKAKMALQHPLGRLGRPEDIAAMAVYLLSEDAGWISGQIIGVDGGRSSLSL